MDKTLQELTELVNNAKFTPATPQQLAENLSKGPYVVQNASGERELIKGSPEMASYSLAKQPLVKDAAGGYTPYIPKVSLNTETGDIDIHVPKTIMEEDWFKKQFSENENLKKLSQVYKLNPGYSFETTDENGKTIYKKAEELINEYDESLKKAYESLNQLHAERDRILRPVYGDKVDNMSTEDIRIALTPTYNVGDYKVTGSTVISLPDFLLNHPIFGAQIKKLDSYNADEGTVTRSDFMENFWNRNKNPELTAERIQELYQNLGTTLQYSNWQNVEEDDYVRHGSNQAAREIAFRNFIQGQDPEADFLLSAGDIATSIVGGIGMGLIDAGIGVANLMESVNNFLTPGDELDSQVIKQTAEGWESWKEYNNEQLQLISDASANFTNIAEFATELAANIYLGNVAANAVGAVAGEILGTVVNKAQITQSSSLGKMIGGFAAALDSTQEAGKTIKSAIGAQKAFATGGALAGSIVNITTQAIVDATLTNPVLFRQAIDGEGGEEAQNYLSEQYAWNVLGFGMGIGLSKVVMAGAETKVGRAINAKWSQANAKLKTVGYNISDSIKANILHRSLEDTIAETAENAAKKGDDVYKIKSQRTREQLQAIKDETRAFAKADIDVFDGLKISDDGLAEAEGYIARIKNLQNAVDVENRSLKLWVESYDDIKVNPEMAGLNKALYKNERSYVDIERKITHNTGKAFTPMQGTAFSQEAANYIGAKVELNYMETVIASPDSFSPNTVASASKNIDSYRDAIAKYSNEYGAEWTKSLDDYIDTDRKWYASMNQYRVSKGITNAQDLDDLLQSPLFKDGDYMRVQRVKDKRYLDITLADGSKKTNMNIDFQHLGFDKFSDFMAPDTVQNMYKWNTAKVERNTQVLKMRLSAKSAMKDILVSGEDTQFLKNYKASRAEFDRVADEMTSKYVKESAHFNASSLADDYNTVIKKDLAVNQAAKDVRKAERAAARTPNIRINDSDRLMAAQTLAPTDVSSRLQAAGKSASGSILQDGLDEFGDDSVAFNKWYQGLPEESKDSINRVRREYNKFIGGMDSPDDLDAAELFLRDSTSQESAQLKRISRSNLETLIGIDPNLEDTVNFQVFENDKALMKSQDIDDLVRENKIVNDNFVKNEILKSERAQLEKFIGAQQTDEFMDSIIDFTDRSLDEYLGAMRGDDKTQKLIRTITERSGASEDDVARYLSLKALKRNQKVVNKQITDAFGKADKKMSHIGREVNKAFDNMLDDAIDRSMLALQGSPLVDGEIYDEVKKLAREIEGVEASAKDEFSNVIATMDAQGRKVFMAVDPATAKLFKTNIDDLKVPTNVLDKANKMVSKVFRLGTTGLNLSSTMRQWFRDSGNAFGMGGAFRKIQSCADELVEDFGERIVSQLSDFDYKQLAKRAEETGEDIKRLAVERELRMGQIAAGQTTEAELFTESLTKSKEMKNKVEKAYEKLEDIMNNKRESYLRNRVYANNLALAMDRGYTLEQARTVAEFAMNNATTNFSRKLVHLQRVADSTPYLSAAINGSKSFWRMATLDPVGVMTRIMGGFVIPQMYLTATSLADENNRRVYENMPEYTKSENLVFVHNGIAMTVPIPQELAFIVDPFRQFMEGLYGANKNDFWELAANDILGAMPIDFAGFSAVDMDDMISDPTIFDRLGRGVSRVFSQVAPIPIKSAYMVATGIDPYSGKKLRDKSWVVWNDDTGDYETMDYNQGSFAKLVTSWLGNNANGAITEKVLSGIFGNTGMDVLDSIVATFQKVGGDADADPTEGLRSQLERIGSSLTGEDYSTLNSEWQRAIAELEDQRDSIMASKEMQDIQNKLGQDIDDTTRQKLLAKRKDLLADWQKSVSSVASRLVEQGGTLDRYKFAAVAQLLNMNSVNGWVPANKYLQDLTSQNYYAGRAEAYKTMQEIGITGVGDYSIFGYVKYKDNQPQVVYNSPTAIVTAGNLVMNAADVDRANIEAIIKKNDLYTQREEMYNQTNAIYNKKKLTNADYNQIDAIKMAYNNKALAALVPYLERVTPEAITNNEQVMDILENIIQVPSSYEKVNNRYVSSGGGKLNKQQGFVRSYIKAVLNKENM